MPQLVPIAQIQGKHPWWPYKPDGTYRLIKLKRLGCVRIGRNVFVTEELLREAIDANTEHLGRRHDELETIAATFKAATK